MSKIQFKTIFKHLHTIHTHRKWVRYYCFLAGIPWRGITHDLSKYSPIEFWESVKFYTGFNSPIENAKKAQGYSRAWLHHRGRNTHHWAYWADNFSEGMTVHLMPEKDFVEMVCDFLGAGQAYSRESFTYYKEYKWWQKEREGGCKAMHPANKKMLDIILWDLQVAENPVKYGHLRKMVHTPEQLLKLGYIQDVYNANKNYTE